MDAKGVSCHTCHAGGESKVVGRFKGKVLNQTEADGVGEKMMETGEFNLNLET